MDTDELNNRLKRLYRSVDKSFNFDIPKFVNFKHEKTDTGGKGTMSFTREEDKPEIENGIFSIISNLASLKDHLGRGLVSKGLDRTLIESEIEQSEHLKLVIDLNNRDKHGPKRDSRSGKFPMIVNPAYAMTQRNINNSEPAVFEFNPFSGEVRWGENTVIVITAEVRDKNGEYLCSFRELYEKSVDKWEEVIKRCGLTEKT